MAQRALGPAREPARQTADAAVSVRELESEIWPWRLVAIGVALGLTLALPWARVEWLPLGLVVLAYMSAYALLRWSNLACPWFCVLLFGMDIVAITAALLLSGGARSTLVLMYMFPVAVMAIARGPWAAATLATAVLALYVGTTGPGAALRSAPKDTAALALVLYGSAIVVGRAHAEIRRRETNLAKRLAKLHQGVARISGEASLATLLDESAALGTELTGACYGAISIWDERDETVCLATAGTGAAKMARVGHPPSGSGLLEAGTGRTRAGRCGQRQGAPVASPQPNSHPEKASFLVAPIPALGDWKGAYYLVGKQGAQSFTAADEQLAEMLAAHVASAVVLRRLVASQREMHEDLLEMLVQVSDAREHALAGHSRRVSSYARALGELAGLSGEELDVVAIGGLLHDIGKIAVPDSILSKPGPLDADEIVVMMSHSGIGAAIVARAGQLAKAAPFVRHHHERWDGDGYPDGLKAEAIPLGARIVALADMLDAATTDRPYRAARTMGEVIEEVERCAGTHFDPPSLRSRLASHRWCRPARRRRAPRASTSPASGSGRWQNCTAVYRRQDGGSSAGSRPSSTSYSICRSLHSAFSGSCALSSTSRGRRSPSLRTAANCYA
jgi:putative nucleotidyltransferase with HDIG domain